MSVIYYPLVICQGDINQADIRKIFIQALIYSLHMTHCTSLFSWADNTEALLTAYFFLCLEVFKAFLSLAVNHSLACRYILYTHAYSASALLITCLSVHVFASFILECHFHDWKRKSKPVSCLPHPKFLVKFPAASISTA